MRSRPPSAMLLLALVAVATSLAQEASAATSPGIAPPASITGELAFSDIIVFDYDRDGTPDRVQFWIELEGLQAIGRAGDAGARAESGSVRYFVVDVERQRRIDDWLLGFNMEGGFPVAGQAYPITDIRIEGRTAQFGLTGSTWTVTDKGDSWSKDSIEIETGGRKRQGRFYGGDLTVTPGPPAPPKQASIDSAGAPAPGSVAAGPVARGTAEPAGNELGGHPRQNRVDGGIGLPPAPPRLATPVDVEANRKCIRCHAEAAMTMAGGGGPHGELECVSCHTRYHQADENNWPLCLNCHNSHSESITMRMCRNCHSSHDVEAIRYDLKVPDAHCTACHKKSAARLRESGTRHTGLACVICHRSNHPTVPTCVDCHSGPHAARVMSKPDRCIRCHDSAHQTSVDR